MGCLTFQGPQHSPGAALAPLGKTDHISSPLFSPVPQPSASQPGNGELLCLIRLISTGDTKS